MEHNRILSPTGRQGDGMWISLYQKSTTAMNSKAIWPSFKVPSGVPQTTILQCCSFAEIVLDGVIPGFPHWEWRKEVGFSVWCCMILYKHTLHYTLPPPIQPRTIQTWPSSSWRRSSNPWSTPLCTWTRLASKSPEQNISLMLQKYLR